MMLPFNGSASARFGNSHRLIRLLAAGMATVFAGVSMADPVTVTLSNLTHTYNGSPKSATVTTSPIPAACTVTYAGSTTPPTNAGNYAVVATVDAPNTGPGATGTLVISKASQTITFADFTKTYGDASFTLPGTSSSGLPLSYTTLQTTIVTISGTTATILKAGAANITASQAGNTNYLAATSVTKRLTVNKKTLNYSLVVPAGKTYGDAPFTVSATVSDGFSITKWESADPSVATISPTGEVTIVGAGQTSIIGNIPSTAGTNYDPTWVAMPLNVARSVAPLPSPSGTETVTYDGNPHGVDPVSLPAGLATETTYRNTSTPEATATPVVVFQNGKDNLDLNYPSIGLQSARIWGQAKYMELVGTGIANAARKLHSCDVTLVTWAGYFFGVDNNPSYRSKEWADANPALVVVPTPGVSIPGVDSYGYPIPGNSGGWYHPVTLAFYAYDIVSGTESYRLLTSKTVQAFIPWRPEKLADNVTAFTNSGYAFRVPFDFPEGVILPDQVWVAVSFNTESAGVAPIRVTGPYNALNIPTPDGQQAGLTLTGTKHYLFKDWRWQQAIQPAGPMLRLRAVPTNAILAAPVNAGNYEVKTQASAFGAEGVSTSTLEIIGHTFEAWRTATFATSGLPPEKTTDIADPDGDGLNNFLEYAFNLNPLQGDQPSPTGLEQGGATMAFTYRRNLNALNLNYSIQGSSQLADPLSWAPVTPLGETPISDDGATRVIQATVAKPADTPCYFLRLKAASP